MKTAKTSKRALLCSVLSIALCLSMLIGTTFAWFTDTATTSVNQIKAGTLDVDLQIKAANGNWVTAVGETLNFVKADGHATEPVLWEPGATYKLPELRVVNNGNLALKYKVVISGAKDATPDNGKNDLLLLNVIDWTYSIQGQGGAEAADLSTERHLAAKTTGAAPYDTLTIQGQMQITAGNEYQGMEIEGISITVYATQDTVEYDSTGKDYDADAACLASTSAQLKTAMAAGGTVAVEQDIDAKYTMVASSNTATTLDVGGNTISNTEDLWDKEPNGWSLVSAQNGADLTITGNGTFKAKENDCYAVDVQDGSTVTIEDGTFIGNIHAVYVQQGTAYIKGGFYSVQQKYPDAAKADEFVLNCYDANRANGSAKINVTGGTFVNFNPADCWAEGAHTKFVADGYTVVSEAHGSDTWYTVVPNN